MAVCVAFLGKIPYQRGASYDRMTKTFMKHKFSFMAAVLGLLVSLRDLKIYMNTREKPGNSVYSFLRILMSIIKLKILKFPINQACTGVLGLGTALLGLRNKLN